MKKRLSIILLMAIVVFAVMFAACDRTPHVHDLEHIDAVPSTCVQAGVEEYWHCTDCNKYFSDAKGTTEITAPKEAPALGHTLVHHDKVDATCTEEGAKEYWSCSVCEKNFADEQGQTELADIAISAIDHEWGEVSYVWAEDNSTCTATRTCSRDAGHVETETVNSVPTVTQSSSCTTDELTKYVATFENSAFAEQTKADIKTGEKGEHNYNVFVSYVEEPTCTEKGSATYKCAGCDLTTTKDVNVLNHEITHCEAVPEKCTEAGSIEYWYCSRCKKYFSDSNATKEVAESSIIINAKGHSPSKEYSKDKDYHWYDCTNENCNEKVDREAHDFGRGVDIDENISKFICADCSYEKNDVYATGKITGTLSGTGVTDYSNFTLVLSGKYTYTFADAVNADGTFSIDARLGEDWTLLAYSRNGYASDVTAKFNVVAENNAVQNIVVECGKVILGDVTVNGRLVKAYGNLDKAFVDENGVFTADSRTISNISTTQWKERVRYMFPIATQVKSGVFAFDTTLSSTAHMYGYAGVGITDGNAIFYIETPSQTSVDGGGVRICFGTYTETGWDFKFAMVMKCGGVDAQTPTNYKQRFSIRRYADCFKLYSGDICFATLTAENGLTAQDNYKMVNNPFFLKQHNGDTLAGFMSANEYALLYGCDYGIANSCSYVSEFNNEYVMASGSVALPEGATGNLADTRLVVSNENKTYTYSNAVDEKGNYAIEIATGTYDFVFTNPAIMGASLSDVVVSATNTTISDVQLVSSSASSSSVIVNNMEIKMGENVADLSNITTTRTSKYFVVGNSVYGSDTEYKYSVSMKAGGYNSTASVGITDGQSLIRLSMWNGYKRAFDLEYCTFNEDKTSVSATAYLLHDVSTGPENEAKKFMPGWNGGVTFTGSSYGTTPEWLTFTFWKKADGSLELYFAEHLVVTIKSDGIYKSSNVTCSKAAENGKLCSINTNFVAVGREYAAWGGIFNNTNKNSIDYALQVAIEPIRAEEVKDTKADALNEVLKDKYFSILGDSISTWDGISNSGENNDTINSGYNSCYPYYDVDKLEEVYWYQLMQKTGMNLLVNNSIGGSRAYGEVSDATAACNDRCVNLHANTGDLAGTNPDIIFVYIGINDVGHSTETVEQFIQGYRQIIKKITEKYADSQVFIIDLPYPGSSNTAKYDLEKFNKCNEAINSIAEEFSLPVIHLRNSIADDSTNMTCDKLHPNVAGMAAYYQVIRDALYDFYCVD